MVVYVFGLVGFTSSGFAFDGTDGYPEELTMRHMGAGETLGITD
jgi:hypothetical protein